MARTLITGMSGAGKSTVLTELARRGHQTVDTDYGGWVTAQGLWDEVRMTALLASEPDVFVPEQWNIKVACMTASTMSCCFRHLSKCS